MSVRSSTAISRGGRWRARSKRNNSGVVEDAQVVPKTGEELAATSATISRQVRTKPPPLTHFLSLPIGHHVDLRQRMSGFTSSLSDMNIPGLHPTIIVPPRRLHLTLGVMSLETESGVANSKSPGQPANPPITRFSESIPRKHTVSDALALLKDLQPQIKNILAGERLVVPLERMDIMKPDRGDLEKAHVLWMGPANDGEDARRLRDVCNLLHQSFTKAGLLVDQHRPLKLHCTIVNTSHRKPRPKQAKGGREPFSYTAVLQSDAFRNIASSSSPLLEEGLKFQGPAEVDLGRWSVDEIQVCEMGSWGPEGEYVSVGGCTL